MDGNWNGAWSLHCSRMVMAIPVVLVLAACGGTSERTSSDNDANAPSTSTIGRADWDARSLLLTVSGTWSATATTDSPLLLSDADTAEVLMDVPLATGQTGYVAVIEDLTSVPCAISVSDGTTQIRRVVDNAPPNCADFVASHDLRFDVRRAVWRSERAALSIEGVSPVPNVVTLTYPGTATVLAAVPVSDRLGRTLGFWRIHIVGLDPTRVPCTLSVTTGTDTEVFGVQGAPVTCIGNPGTPPPIPNQAPTGRVIAPLAPATIVAGESVSFAGDGTDPDNHLPLTYAWDFAGGAAASTMQNPGPVVFATAGSYAVKLTVRDGLGLADPNPPTLLVTVNAAAPPLNQAPSGRIVSPASPVTIVAGESVSFAGDGTDPDNNLPLTYAWDFAGGAAASTLQNPGPVVFAAAGNYAVTLTVRDSLGLADSNPPTLAIVVNPATPVPAVPPSGTIVDPAADVTVVAGSPVTFRASATDPGNLAVSYRWAFGGGAIPSTAQDPGAVIFATPGIYPVTMIATNSANLADPTPETRTITVSAAQATPVVIGAALFGAVTPDKDFSVASWIPLGNSLRAQVVNGNVLPTDKPALLADSAVKMVYAAQADPKGSITTTSIGKTTFWPAGNTAYLFMLPPGVTLQGDQGLQGTQKRLSQNMPGTVNAPQLFGNFDATSGVSAFTARAIPVVPLDDANQRNNYPLFRMSAQDVTSGTVLAHLDTVLAVGDEQDCATGCHATGGNAADAATAARLGGVITWSANPDLANQAKDNIWIMHDSLFGTPPSGTTQDACARCHYTPSADPDGLGPQGTQQLRRPWLAEALHRVHGLGLTGAPPSATVPPVMTDDQCGRCHEAGGARLSRGAMLTAGQVCKDCHGGMLALAAQFQLVTTPPRARLAFVDQPRCESCHIGDNLSVTTGPLVLRQAFDVADPAATPRLVPTSRYAQEPGKLFSASVGHGKMTCIGCHGSTHAEWPVDDVAANDNATPVHLQGHRGVLTDCKACHVGGVDVKLLNGPHGLHAVNDPGWVAQHAPVYTADPAVCKACHGATLDGSYLSRAATDSSFLKEDGAAKLYRAGDVVGCADCHAKP